MARFEKAAVLLINLAFLAYLASQLAEALQGKPMDFGGIWTVGVGYVLEFLFLFVLFSSIFMELPPNWRETKIGPFIGILMQPEKIRIRPVSEIGSGDWIFGGVVAAFFTALGYLAVRQYVQVDASYAAAVLGTIWASFMLKTHEVHRLLAANPKEARQTLAKSRYLLRDTLIFGGGFWLLNLTNAFREAPWFLTLYVAIIVGYRTWQDWKG